jgi:hypothetical protein
MEMDFSDTAVFLTVLHCGYAAPCRVHRCAQRATTILRKADAGGRFLRQVETCDAHTEQVLARERGHGLQVTDRRA